MAGSFIINMSSISYMYQAKETNCYVAMHDAIGTGRARKRGGHI